SFDTPTGRMTMNNRHVDKNMYLAECRGTEFQVGEGFKHVKWGQTCAGGRRAPINPLVVTQVMNVVYEVTTLVVIVLGLAIVFGFLGVMNLAHGEFIAIGAYTAYVCQARGWSYVTAIPAACLVCGALALLVGGVLTRPLYQRPFDTMLATWGLSLLLRKTIELVYGGGYKSLVVPLSGSVSVLGAPFPAYRVLLIVLSLAGTI